MAAEGVVAVILGLLFLFEPLGGSSVTLLADGSHPAARCAHHDLPAVARHGAAGPRDPGGLPVRLGRHGRPGDSSWPPSSLTATDAVTAAMAVVVGIGFLVFGLTGIAASFIRRRADAALPLLALVVNGLLALAGLVLLFAGAAGSSAPWTASSSCSASCSSWPGWAWAATPTSCASRSPTACEADRSAVRRRLALTGTATVDAWRDRSARRRPRSTCAPSPSAPDAYVMADEPCPSSRSLSKPYERRGPGQPEPGRRRPLADADGPGATWQASEHVLVGAVVADGETMSDPRRASALSRPASLPLLAQAKRTSTTLLPRRTVARCPRAGSPAWPPARWPARPRTRRRPAGSASPAPAPSPRRRHRGRWPRTARGRGGHACFQARSAPSRRGSHAEPSGGRTQRAVLGRKPEARDVPNQRSRSARPRPLMTATVVSGNAARLATRSSRSRLGHGVRGRRAMGTSVPS